MSCFTTTTTVPLRNCGPGSRVFTVLIDDHIWILHSNNKNSELFKFNTVTFQLEVVDCVFPQGLDRRPVQVTSDQHYIYVVVCSDDEHIIKEEGWAFDITPIFKFDTHTLRWEFVMNYDFGNISWLGPIVDNQMHFVQLVQEPCQKRLMKLNLVTNEIEQTPFQSVPDAALSLIVENNQIYVIFDSSEDGTKRVSKVNNGVLEILNTYHWNNIERKTLEHKNYTVENGYVLEVQRRTRSIDASDASTVYIDMFDSTSLSWNRTDVPGFIRKGTWCFSNLIMKKDKVFAVFMERPGRKHNFSIRMFEAVPSLSTICMLDLIDRKNDTSELDPIIDHLSIPLKYKLENMLEWRIPENSARLAKEQKAKVIEEIGKIEDDGVVDHSMRRKLQTVFDSDFSDQSGSDITDAESEPSEESDDENARRLNDRRDPEDERKMWGEAEDLDFLWD